MHQLLMQLHPMAMHRLINKDQTIAEQGMAKATGPIAAMRGSRANVRISRVPSMMSIHLAQTPSPRPTKKWPSMWLVPFLVLESTRPP
jgi:hypothetical protein